MSHMTEHVSSFSNTLVFTRYDRFHIISFVLVWTEGQSVETNMHFKCINVNVAEEYTFLNDSQLDGSEKGDIQHVFCFCTYRPIPKPNH